MNNGKTNQTWLVAKNLYRNRVKGIGFWAMVLSPFLIAGIYLLIGLIIQSGVTGTTRVAVVNNQPVAQILKQNKSLHSEISESDRLETAKSQLMDQKIDAYLVVEDDKFSLITSKNSANKFSQQTFQSALTQANMLVTASKLGLSQGDVQSLLQPAKLSIQTQTETGENKGGDNATGAKIAVGTVASILIFIVLMMYVGVIGQEIGNEKSSRIMETLLAATSTKVQYYGKILGVVLLMVTQIALYAVGFGIAYPFIRHMEVVKQVQSYLTGIDFAFGLYIIVMVFVGTVGYLFLASIVASLVNEQAQVQQAVQPISFLSMIGYIGGIAGAAVPGNLILKVMSFIPFISPTLMTSQYAVQYATSFEAWLAAGLQVVATVVIAKAGEKIYARNVLSYSDDKIMSQFFKNLRENSFK